MLIYLANIFSPAIPPLMQPLIIVLLIALIWALTSLRKVDIMLHEAQNYGTAQFKKHMAMRAQYDAAIISANRANLDNTFLRAELKRKHRRVPKL